MRIQNRRSSSVKTAQIDSLEKHKVYLSGDLVEHSAEFMLDIRNDKVSGVRLAIPRDVQVHTVTGQGIAGWTREAQADQDILQLDFHVPVTGITQFTVELYRYRNDPQEDFILGDVRLLDAADRQGQLAIYYDANIRLDVKDTTHLEPIPAGHAVSPHKPDFFIYRRYHVYNLPYTITLSRAPVPKQVELGQYNLLKLAKEQITFRSSLNFSGLKEGTSQFDFTHPADFRVKDVQVYVNNQVVAENHKYLASEGILRVDIVHPVRASDLVGFSVNAERLIDQDQFKSGPQKISVPVLTFAGTERTEGTLRIEIADDFLLEDIALEGYRPAEEMLIAVPQREGHKAMTYRYRVLEPRGQLTLSKRRAEQTSDTVSFITVDDDLLRANAYVRYQLTAGTQEQFYFAIPAWEGSKVNIEGNQIKEKKKVPLESIRDRVKLPKGVDLARHDIWNVVLQKEASANYELIVDYQKKIDRFNEFQPVPLIMPLDVSNDTGYLVLEASKNTEISSEKQGLSEVETYEIPAWPAYKPSNRIIESLRYFTQPYIFRMAVKRMEELPVLAALIKSETLAYTFDTESQIFFEGTYIIRNTNQQFLEIILPEHFMFWGATVEGTGIKPRKGSDRQLYIPLPVDNAGDIRLQLTGQVPKMGGFGIFDRMKVQSPRLGLPVLESTVLVYYPPDYSLLNVKGNFEKLPKIKPQEPVLSYFLGTAFSTLWNNARRLFRLPGIYRVQGRLKSAADDIGDQFTAGNTSVVSLTRSQVQQVMPGQRALQARVRDAAEYLEEMEEVNTQQYEPYYLSTDYDVAKDKEVARKPKSPMPSYARKEGLLSLSIDI
ncbi:MAG: hypothetical protein K8I00_02275, partial [Candidatus Omnitrophica bacterium]|nr:hypothetical protein [Candidatus Omnitrophota bacterium]